MKPRAVLPPAHRPAERSRARRVAAPTSVLDAARWLPGRRRRAIAPQSSSRHRSAGESSPGRRDWRLVAHRSGASLRAPRECLADPRPRARAVRRRQPAPKSPADNENPSERPQTDRPRRFATRLRPLVMRYRRRRASDPRRFRARLAAALASRSVRRRQTVPARPRRRRRASWPPRPRPARCGCCAVPRQRRTCRAT